MQIDIKWCWNNLTDRFYCFCFFFSFFLFTFLGFLSILYHHHLRRRPRPPPPPTLSLGFYLSQWPNQSATSASQSLLYDHPFHANSTNWNAQSTQHIQHAHVCLCNAAQYVGYTPLGLNTHSHFQTKFKQTIMITNRILKFKVKKKKILENTITKKNR